MGGFGECEVDVLKWVILGKIWEVFVERRILRWQLEVVILEMGW